MRSLICVFILAICLSACGTKKEVAKVANKTEVADLSADIVGKGCVGDHNIVWDDVTESLSRRLQGKEKGKYRLFSIDPRNLEKVIMDNVRANSSFELNVPVFANGDLICKTYTLENSGTISTKKQKRLYHFSFRASDPSNPNHTARFDFTKKGLSGYLEMEGPVYMLEPITLGGTKYYVSFNKEEQSDSFINSLGTE